MARPVRDTPHESPYISVGTPTARRVECPCCAQGRVAVLSCRSCCCCTGCAVVTSLTCQVRVQLSIQHFGDLAPVTLHPDGDSNPGTNPQLTYKSSHVTSRIMFKPGQSLPLSRRHNTTCDTDKHRLFKTKIHKDKYK
jgi:hypothetical protein